MEGFDWGTVITAVVGVAVGVIATLYWNFKKAAAADNVADWKDEAVKVGDQLIDKLKNEPK
ncbi:MAG: hypothetical protein MN733_09650 [Nitrososphaera sp.]|nr:hypothetical protein [Nitrososphaera sp.]